MNLQAISNQSIMPLNDLFKELSSSAEGLTTELALKNIAIYGPNSLDLNQKRPAVIEWLMAFIAPLPMLLIALSLISFFIGETKGAVVIGLMIFLSTTFAFIQEFRSTQAAEKLKELVSIKVTVIRDQKAIDIPLREVVPGDVVTLSAGDLIPGDLRLIEAKDLFVNQSALTGEALPVERRAQAQSDEKGADAPNICLMGTHVTSGLGKGLILATATNTQFGALAKDINTHRKKTGFDLGIEKFIWLMIKFMVILVPLVFLVNGLVKGDWLEALMFATAVAVGLTPEMLPLLVTINLAKGAIAMSKKKVIVKRLNSIQNLGAMDILCTDKTGTLTQDQIILEKHVNTSNDEDDEVLKYAYLNSHFQSGLKNLMDEAVLSHAKTHLDSSLHTLYTKVDEIPFDFERRRMSVILEEHNGGCLLICKGAIEELTNHCSHILLNGVEQVLTPSILKSQHEISEGLNEDGFRVVAVAIRRIQNQKTFEISDENNLCLIGYVAFLDPPKESAKPAIQTLKESGVSVKILTGDNEIITRKICSQVGLETPEILVGREIENLSDEELGLRAKACNVFAKLNPQQKARIISCLQQQNHIVGYMGDGINDGSALKVSDVGISVDTAVDVAKDTADIILLEKNLLVTHDGVIEGRKVFGNIMKYIRMSASSNFGNMFSMLGASALLPFLPMAPVQILLNNFLYDCSQTAVPTDNVDIEYLEKPRVWDIGSIAKFMIYIGPLSSIFDYATFGLMWFVIGAQDMSQMSVFQTGWFVESLLSQTLIVYIIRTNRIPFIESKPSPFLIFTSLSICAIGILIPYTPLGASLEMTPLPQEYWLGLTLIIATYLTLTFFVKQFLWRKKIIAL